MTSIDYQYIKDMGIRGVSQISFIRKIFRFSKLFMDANTRYWNCFVYNNMHILGL